MFICEEEKTNKKKVAILGASYLQLPLIFKAKDNGIEVHCFAWDNEKAVCKNHADFFYDISVLDKENILKKCKEIKIDGILTIATDICIPTISYISNKLNLIGNSEFCAEVTTNKVKMRELFNSKGVLCPKTIKVNNLDSISEKELNFPLIVKPSDRSGSLGVEKVYNKKDLLLAMNEAIEVSFKKECIVEEFVEGVEISVEVISYKGKHKVITITDKIVTGSPYFVELEHHQPSMLDSKIQNKIHKIAIKILELSKVQNGASHIEFKIDKENEIYLIEIGTRMGGDFIGSDLVNLSTGFDYLDAVLKVSIGQFTFPEIIESTKFSGVYFVCDQTKRLSKYFSIDTDSNLKHIIRKEKTNKELVLAKNSNDRSGYIIYQASSKLIL